MNVSEMIKYLQNEVKETKRQCRDDLKEKELYYRNLLEYEREEHEKEKKEYIATIIEMSKKQSKTENTQQFDLPTYDDNIEEMNVDETPQDSADIKPFTEQKDKYPNSYLGADAIINTDDD